MNALTLGLLAALCWGFHDICVRFLSQKVPISACMLTVLTVGLGFHIGLMGVEGALGSVWTVPAAAVWLSLGAGVCFVVATVGLYLAFQRGPVRLVAPLIASYPILSMLWALADGVSITALQWAAVLAIVAGVGWVAALSDTSVDATPPKAPTVLFSLIAAAGFAGTFALGQAASEAAAELPTTLITRLTAAGVLLALLVAMRQPLWPGARALPLLVAMGVADGIALLCVLSAGGLPDATYAAVTSSMFGLLTIVFAWVLLRERMTALQWAGCVVAFYGVGVLAV